MDPVPYSPYVPDPYLLGSNLSVFELYLKSYAWNCHQKFKAVVK